RPHIDSYSPLPARPLLTPAPCLAFLDAPAPADAPTLSLHDALPIFRTLVGHVHQARTGNRLDFETGHQQADGLLLALLPLGVREDRKSTRLNSSHVKISYAVFCLKKKISR